ncbi:sugar transferase [Mesorhizobium sp. KR1-2]|uniref:sugar transferase n=1 Tax=Mesorhizobium sp. KR1-2 TaxID=3156609 RepID=UPI0032B339A9
MSSLASSASSSGLSKATAMLDRAISTSNPPPLTDTTPAEICEQTGLRKPVPLKRALPWMATLLLLVAGDIGAYLVAYLLFLPFLPGDSKGVALEPAFTLAALAAILLYASASLYPGYRLHDHEHLRRRATASIKVAALAALAAILLSAGPGLLLATIGFLGVGLVLQPVTHWAARGLCWRLGIWGERAAIVAGRNRIPALMAHFTYRWQYGIRPEPYSPDTLGISPENKPRIALIAGDTGSLLDEITTMRREFAEVILLSDMPNFKITGLQPADVGGEIGVRLAVGENPVDLNLVRRALDLAIAIPAMLLFAPFILIAAAAIYAIDPGPVFFRQAREGLAGKPVHVLKLRTMYRDAEQRLDALIRENPAIRTEWLTHFKLRHDPRILPVIGHILRSTSFDELPQLVNVITGEMALVGPRPFPEYHLRAMDGDFRHKRHSVTPGLTGLWQISERSNADLNLQQQLDEFYIDNKSIWFDWHILLRTIPAVFKRSGAF